MSTHPGEHDNFLGGGQKQKQARLYFCATFTWFLSQCFLFGYLLFIHASTNATDDQKCSPLPSADFDIAKVLVSFSAFIFL